MAVVKVIELLGESEQSWDDAARKVVEEATRTLRGVTSVYIKEFQATVENDGSRTSGLAPLPWSGGCSGDYGSVPHESPHFHWLSYGRDSPTFRRTSVSRRRTSVSRTDGCGLWSRRHVRSGVWARFVVSSAGCMGLTCIPSGSMRWQAPRSE